jgi:hypothetical protein
MKFKDLEMGDLFGFDKDELEETYRKVSDRKYDNINGIEYRVVTINSEVYLIPENNVHEI